jgi:hypothetical protein
MECEDCGGLGYFVDLVNTPERGVHKIAMDCQKCKKKTCFWCGKEMDKDDIHLGCERCRAEREIMEETRYGCD